MDAPLPAPDLRPAASLAVQSVTRPGATPEAAPPAGGEASAGSSLELGVLIVALLAAVLVWVRAKFVAGASAAATDRGRARGARPRPVDAWAESGRRLRVPPEAGDGGHESRGGL